MARKSKKGNDRPARASKAEVVEPVLEEVDTGGAGIEEGIIFTTFVLLGLSVFMIYTLLQERFPV